MIEQTCLLLSNEFTATSQNKKKRKSVGKVLPKTKPNEKEIPKKVWCSFDGCKK